MRTSDDEMRRNGHSSQVLQFCAGLQLSLSQNKKQKNSWKNIGLKVKMVKKIRGIRPFFRLKACSGTMSHCTIDYCQTSTCHKSIKLASKQTITTINEKNGWCRIEMRPCEHDRTVLSHPSTVLVPSPPDEARRLQPDTEFLRVPVVPLQVWMHLRRRAHRGNDGGVALQRGAEFCENRAELVQRTAAPDLDFPVPRVPPQGSEHRVRRWLRRQTGEVRVLQLQKAAQRARGLVRSLRV